MGEIALAKKKAAPHGRGLQEPEGGYVQKTWSSNLLMVVSNPNRCGKVGARKRPTGDGGALFDLQPSLFPLYYLCSIKSPHSFQTVGNDNL